MLRSSLCDYSDAYILGIYILYMYIYIYIYIYKGNISVNNTAAQGAAPNNTNKK